MIGLILDTSTDHTLLGVSKDNRLVDWVATPHGQNLSKTLLPSLQDILNKHDLQLKDVSKISVGIGPGSYTGTRVGVAVAQSLAFALSIPLYSFCSLLAFIPQKLPQGPFAFLFDSKHSSIFLLKGFHHEGSIQKNLSQALLPIDQMLPHLEDAQHLVSFDPEAVSKRLSHFLPDCHCLQAQANLSFLLPYLASLEPAPPSSPEIIYLHQI
jgi:tRNA threonylcarbamoyladenosine biosynthesis protein TsaB